MKKSINSFVIILIQVALLSLAVFDMYTTSYAGFANAFWRDIYLTCLMAIILTCDLIMFLRKGTVLEN